MSEVQKHEKGAPLASSLKQAAERTGLSVNYLRACIAEGRLRAVRFGRVLRIRESDLVRFVDEGVETSIGQ